MRKFAGIIAGVTTGVVLISIFSEMFLSVDGTLGIDSMVGLWGVGALLAYNLICSEYPLNQAVRFALLWIITIPVKAGLGVCNSIAQTS